MARLAANKIILTGIVLLVGYWLIMPQLTGYSNALVSTFLIFAGIFVLGSWGLDGWKAALSGIVKGPQLAVIGVAVVALGSVIQGTFSFTWWWVGEPLHWLNTPMSSFGRYVMGIGFFTQYFSDDFQISRFKAPKAWFVITAILISAMVGVMIGYTWGDATSHMGVDEIVRPV